MLLDLGAMPHRHVGSGVWGIWDGGVMGWRSTDLAEEDARQQAAELNVTFNQYGQRDHADRREVSPPIEVESVTWSAAGDLDYLVKERQEWSGRVRLPDRHHVWIRAVDLCEAKAHIDRSFKPPLMRPSLWVLALGVHSCWHHRGAAHQQHPPLQPLRYSLIDTGGTPVAVHTRRSPLPPPGLSHPGHRYHLTRPPKASISSGLSLLLRSHARLTQVVSLDNACSTACQNAPARVRRSGCGPSTPLITQTGPAAG